MGSVASKSFVSQLSKRTIEKAQALWGLIKPKTPHKKENFKSIPNQKTQKKKKKKKNKKKKKKIKSTPDKKTDHLSTKSFHRNQNIKIDTSVPILPPEVITEILSRLPLKAVMRCQTVCQEWRALIHDRYFGQMYTDRGVVVHNFCNVKGQSTSVKPKKDSFSYVHGCDGLVLMKNKKKHCLWNPAARLVLELPDPQDDSRGMVLSFVPATNSYRIVSIYKDKKSGREACEVFTPGRSKYWRRLKFMIKHGEKETISVVASEGAVHCMLVAKTGTETDIEVVSIDLETEKFMLSHFPKLGPLDEWKNFWDLDWDGKLAVADIVGQNIEVMELEDHKKQRWCQKKKVIHLPFLKEDEYGGVGNVIPMFALKGEIWFWLKDKKVFTYTIKTGKLTDKIKSQTFAVTKKLYPYKLSFTTFEGMVPDTKLESRRCRFK